MSEQSATQTKTELSTTTPPSPRPSAFPVAERAVHPAALLFPQMSDDEYTELVADIREHGLRQPIVVDASGQLLDGRHRSRACRELGIEPDVQLWEGNDPVALIMALNLKRRNLSPSQLAAVTVELLPVLEEEARSRSRAALKQNGSHSDVATSPPRTPKQANAAKSRERAAAITGASGRTTQDAKRIKQLDPEAFEEIKQGEITVATAKKKLSANPTGANNTSTLKKKAASKPASANAADDFATTSASSLRLTWTDQIAASIPDSDQNVRVVGELTVTNADGAEVLLHLPPLRTARPAPTKTARTRTR
jgi:ParB-like chromosome segregation protein Spo0J